MVGITVTTAIASNATMAISANMPIVVAAYAGARMRSLGRWGDAVTGTPWRLGAHVYVRSSRYHHDSAHGGLVRHFSQFVRSTCDRRIPAEAPALSRPGTAPGRQSQEIHHDARQHPAENT